MEDYPTSTRLNTERVTWCLCVSAFCEHAGIILKQQFLTEMDEQKFELFWRRRDDCWFEGFIGADELVLEFEELFLLKSEGEVGWLSLKFELSDA